MGQTNDKVAYKCLPLTVANQYGYAVLCPTDFSVEWWGGSSGEDVGFNIKSKDEYMKDSLHSYFGDGTFTLHLDFVIRTPRGFSTYIRGIPNEEKRGIKPLDAIVETDWLPFTFTYNFLFTEPGSYNFKKGEPLFTFFPIERNTVESFELIESRIDEDPEFLKDFKEYSDKREQVADLSLKAGKQVFQNFYRNGTNASGEKVKIKHHITNLLFGGKRGNIK